MKWITLVASKPTTANTWVQATGNFVFMSPVRVNRILVDAYLDVTGPPEVFSVPDLILLVADNLTASGGTPFPKDSNLVKQLAGDFAIPQFGTVGINSAFTSKDGNIDLDLGCGPFCNGLSVIVYAVNLPAGAGSVNFSVTLGVS